MKTHGLIWVKHLSEDPQLSLAKQPGFTLPQPPRLNEASVK